MVFDRIFDFSEMPMERQIAIGMMLPFIPVLIGETLFFYLLIAGQMDIITSFSISLGFSAFGLMLWYMWRDGVRKEILEFEPINAQLYWSKEIVTWENQMIKGRRELKNENILRPVTLDDESLPVFDNPPTYEKEVIVFSKKENKHVRKIMSLPYKPKKIKVGLNDIHVGNPEVIENMLVGWRCAEVELHHASFAPNTIPYKRMQFIHNFPYSDDFFMCPDQFVVHQAQVLSGSSSVVSCDFLYWGERDEPIPVFLVGHSPAHVDLVQMAIGMKPQLQSGVDPDLLAKDIMSIVEAPVEEGVERDITHEISELINWNFSMRNEEVGKRLRMEIDEAITLGDTGLAMEYANLLRQRTHSLQTQKETQKDAVELGMSNWNYWEENMAEIEDLSPLIDFSDWRVILGIVVATVILTVGIYWLWFK